MYASGLRNTQCGSSVCSMPLHAAYSTSRRSTSVSLQVLLQEGEDLAQARGHVPGALHVVDAELLLVGVDADLHASATRSSCRTMTCATSRWT